VWSHNPRQRHCGHGCRWNFDKTFHWRSIQRFWSASRSRLQEYTM